MTLHDITEAPFEPVTDGEAPVGTVMHCPLCGCPFTHGQQSCGSCPLNRGCTLVACPSCGYKFPRSSRLVDWIRSKLAGRRGSP